MPFIWGLFFSVTVFSITNSIYLTTYQVSKVRQIQKLAEENCINIEQKIINRLTNCIVIGLSLFTVDSHSLRGL